MRPVVDLDTWLLEVPIIGGRQEWGRKRPDNSQDEVIESGHSAFNLLEAIQRIRGLTDRPSQNSGAKACKFATPMNQTPKAVFSRRGPAILGNGNTPLALDEACARQNGYQSHHFPLAVVEFVSETPTNTSDGANHRAAVIVGTIVVRTDDHGDLAEWLSKKTVSLSSAHKCVGTQTRPVEKPSQVLDIWPLSLRHEDQC